VFPLVVELSPVPEILFALARFADLDGVLLLDSATRHSRLGRYSFLTADPFRWFKHDRATYGDDPFRPLRDALPRFETPNVPELPPFQGGAAGLLGYDLGGAWERLPQPRNDGFRDPVLAVGLYDWVLAWDHVAHRAWIIAQGFPEVDEAARSKRASERTRWVRERLAGPAARIAAPAPERRFQPLCAPFELCGLQGVASTFDRPGYCDAVRKIIEYVRAGDVFQANLSQRLLAKQEHDPLTLYSRLRKRNPAPFAAYFSTDEWVLLSSSPERFVSVQRGLVETRPIKGTRPRSRNPAEDDLLKAQLLSSEKDRAENVMIVDLLRNDLSKVCRPSSVGVPELCSLETYETVHHLVSAVVGQLEAGKTAWDLFEATFPGGSVTGAPKIRAMEIIAELEPAARGPYCGSLFYVGFDGTCDSSILIRTMIAERGWVRFSVGGGVTARSDPEAEYVETLDKAAGMLNSLGQTRSDRAIHDSAD
jgi:para-aminobenzoate synthetase component 1